MPNFEQDIPTKPKHLEVLTIKLVYRADHVNPGDPDADPPIPQSFSPDFTGGLKYGEYHVSVVDANGVHTRIKKDVGKLQRVSGASRIQEGLAFLNGCIDDFNAKLAQ